jgi:hypothetical protein
VLAQQALLVRCKHPSKRSGSDLRIRSTAWGVIFFALACAEPSETLTADQAGRERCSALCEAADHCQVEPNPQCEEACASTSAGLEVRTQPAVLQRDAQCLAQASCEDGFDALVNTCWNDVRQAVPPTEASVAFCDRMAVPFYECQYFVSPTTCAWLTAQFTEIALKSGAHCAKKSCDELAPCLEKELWFYGNEQEAE